MNELGISLTWLVGQVTLLCGVTAMIYLIARHRHPSAGAAAALTGLLLSGVLTLGVFSPWPRWTLPSEPQGSTVNSAVDGAARSSHGRTSRPVTPDVPSLSNNKSRIDAELESPATAAWTALWQGLRQELAQPTPQPAAAGYRWSGWLAVSLLLAMALGAARLLAGWLTVRRCLRRSPLIDDPPLRETVDVLRAELGCRRTVELRESDEVTSAATVGWRKPVILLPRGWRDWSDTERRAVLAHELAHVTAGDAATWLAAQFGLLLHFYHPLVHWLTHRLRLEQELAADALAARITGSAHTYLTTLAELAVRQPDRPIAWPARAFLPTRGTLLRRIEMLRDTKAQPQRPSTLRRGTVIALTLATGLLIAGLRPPAAQQAVAQQPEKPKASAEATPFNLDNVPASTKLLIGLRPSELASRPEMQAIVKAINEAFEADATGIQFGDIDHVLFILCGPISVEAGEQIFRGPVIEIRMKQPNTFEQFAKAQNLSTIDDMIDLMTKNQPKALTADQRAALREMPEIRQQFLMTLSQIGDLGVGGMYTVDDRTILYGFGKDLSALLDDLDDNSRGKLAWLEKFEPVANDDACIVWDVAAFQPLLQSEFEERPNPIFGMFMPLWENADLVIGGGRLDDRMSLTLTGWSPDAESATKLERTLKSLVPLGRGMLESTKVSVERTPNDIRGALLPAITFAEAALENVDIQQADDRVTVRIQGDGASLALMAAATLPAVQQAREAARRTQTINNLKQIGLAFHNYNDVHQHFPPPVLLGPDGKTKHSWRVAILPLIGQQALYDLYDQSQPWDSEHNRKVLALMPAQFRSPNDEPDSTNTAYFTLVGEHTAVGNTPGEGLTFRDIPDGTSNTLLVVEAKRDIPWTKPEDIPYAADKDLPQLGGWHEGGFFTMIADGSVKFISENVDEKLLRSLITRDGGEELDPR